MAPTSSKSGTRDKDKAVRGMAGARDVAESRARSGHLRRCLEAPQITNTYNITFNNEVHFAEGGGVFPSPPGEGSRPSRPRRTLPASPNIHAETSRAPRPANDVEEIGEVIGEVTEEEESSRNDSGEDELPEPPVAHSTSPTSTERVTRWQQHDSAYGSRRGSKEKHEAYRAKMINGSLNRHSAVEGSSQWKRKARAPSAGSNFEEAATGDGETQRETGGDEDREEGGDNGDESGDEFVHRHMDVASKDDKKESVLVTLDTGTKPDWISQRFLTEVLCMNHNKLTDDDKQEFLDFNGNTFNPIGKVEVMVHSTDFIGFPTRQLTFLVAKKGAFQILLGNRTIKKEKLLCKPPDSRGETAFPAVQTEPKKSERAIIVQSKERQKINGAEHDRLRREAKAKEKKEPKPSSSATAMLAQESKPRRTWDLSSPSPSPSRDARHPVKNTPQSLRKRTKAPVRERSSSTSSSNGGVAIDD